MTSPRDRDLGMDRAITRRDFLDGALCGVAGSLLLPRALRAMPPGDEVWAPEKARGYYPPALTGLRGSHEGSYAVAHELRDGSFLDKDPRDTGEAYDLVVVGAGISGLTAAHLFREHAGPRARILVLDNHDDFGGHAKRNELSDAGRTLLGFGGTFSIESAAPYSATAKKLISDLGIDVARSARVLDRGLYRKLGLRSALFFDRETFGADRLTVDPIAREGLRHAAADSDAWQRFAAEAPLSDAAKADLLRLVKESVDYMPGLGSYEKKARLARMSYADFLKNLVRADAGVVALLQARPHTLYGVGIDAVPAQDAWGLGFPGFQGMGLDAAPGRGMNRDSIPNPEADYFFHFPDGNASIARLLVRRLIPAAMPGRTADDVVTARAAYARLDEGGSPVRIRLNSTVVHVKHRGDPATAREVEVAYVRGGVLGSVRAERCILACWNGMIPYLCPELPEPQREALAYGTKVPIVYTNVLLRRWTAFTRLGVSNAYAPGSFHSEVALDLPVSIGKYRFSRGPEEPIVVHMGRTPCSPGLPARDQHRAGRYELLETSFETFERKIRDQLARMLGGGGFDPARDIAAITVNRWPHGYAYQYNSLFDPFWLEGGELPCVAGRKPFGRIAIANADADAYAYTDAAIDQAHRAVQELLALKA
jgi:spermidine dehydrogenase